jgi:hypothetical protein
MQGTVVMLMALSGLGCHHKYDVAYGPPSYSAFFGMGCYANYYPNYMGTVYAPSCYSACYGATYSGCYSACYPGAYRGGHGCCFLSKLFGCCGCKGGYYGDPYGYMGMTGPGPFMGGPMPFGPPGYLGPGGMLGGPGLGGPYEPPIFGYALQFNYGDPTVDAVPVPTVRPPYPGAGAPSPAPPAPGAPGSSMATPPTPELTTPPPPSPANVPSSNAVRPGA